MLKKLSKKTALRVEVSNNTVVRILILVAAFTLGLQLLYLTRSAITLLIVAFFLAVALNPPVSYLARRLPGGSRGLATAVAYSAVLLAVALVIYAAVPPLITETREFISKVPSYIDELKTGNSLASQAVDTFQLEDELVNLEMQATSKISLAGGPIFSLLQRISANFISVLTVLVLAFFMLIEGPHWVNRFFALQPHAKRERRRVMAAKMYRVITGYVNGQFLVSFIGSLSALIMMSVLRVFNIDIPFIVPLAAVIFLTGLIPLFGNTIGAVFVVAIALFESTIAALIMAAFFIIYQQIENNAIQPVIQAKSVEMTPLMVLIAAIVGVTLAGVLGALIAIPTAACLRLILNDYIERHKGRYGLTGEASDA